MPFGLTNAPTAFQSLMNKVFQPFLRKFVLVFFDDILMYSPSLESHVQHLQQVLSTMRQNKLFAKLSKCVFAKNEVEYLGHVITAEGVAADRKKVECMLTWPTPTTIKGLRGFLGLTGYYRRFVKGYGMVAKPLTELLKKRKFCWSTKAEESFMKLKEVVTTTPVLAMPDFTQPFTLETDACKNGVGAVLMQHGMPVSYFSKALGPKYLGLSTYEKELLAIIIAAQHWKYYLLGGNFTILTD